MSKDIFEQLKDRFENGTPAEKAHMMAAAKVVTKKMRWVPSPGPQTEAYYSQADITLYGGQGGGGKTALLQGLALTAHQRSLILRREFGQLAAILDEIVTFNGTRDGFTQSPKPKLRTPDGRLVEFGGCQHLGDEQDYQGQPHDFIGFDEVTQFLEFQVRFIIGWNRPAAGVNPNQRCRVVMASNPPLGPEGDWVIAFFAPWLDPEYDNPAQPGELRWCITDDDGKDTWVDGPGKYKLKSGKVVSAMSRTFIPARLSDNPFLANTNYQSVLDSFPEPLRSAVRDGNFMAGRQDADLQVIPSTWVHAAQKRWEERHKVRPGPPDEVPMTSLGNDPAKGGKDENVIAPRYDFWFDNLIVKPGSETPEGKDTAALLFVNRRHGAHIGIDVGGGYGDAAFEILSGNIDAGREPGTPRAVHKFDGASTSVAKAQGKTVSFANLRAQAWWQFREALDPGQEGGSNVELPPDPKLLRDLTTPRLVPDVLAKKVIQIESKPDLKKRLGRSPDRGDAVVIAWWVGAHAKTHAKIWNKHHAEQASRGSSRPQAIDPYAHRRRQH